MPPDPHWHPAAGGSAPDPQTQPPHYEFLATRLHIHSIFNVYVRRSMTRLSWFSTGANLGCFCVKKIYFWLPSLSKILVGCLVAFTAVDRFFKRLMATDKTS